MDVKKRLEQLDAAIDKIETGGQEYQMGSKRLVRADLAKLYEQRQSLASQLERENGNGTYIATFEGR